MEIKSVALTDPGLKKSSNEDSFIQDEKNNLFIVADGMGGAKRGTFASQKACELIHKKFIRKLPILKNLIESTDPDDSEKMKLEWDTIINEASLELLTMAQKEPELKGMATTLTLLWMANDKAYLAHVGDSRCYLRRETGLHLLTRDHTYGEQARAKGLDTNIPKAKALTQAVGFSKRVMIDHLIIELEHDDRFLICSDGLTDQLPSASLAVSLGEKIRSANMKDLIEMAKERSARDNITLIAISVDLPAINDITSTTKHQYLKVLPFFEKLSYTDITQLLEISHQRDFSRNQHILKDGEHGRQFYVIIQGSVCIKKGEKTVSSLSVGDYFGEMSLIDGQSRSADVFSTDETILLEFSHERFFRLIQSNHQLGVKILWNFNKRFTSLIRSLNTQNDSHSNSDDTRDNDFTFIDV